MDCRAQTDDLLVCQQRAAMTAGQPHSSCASPVTHGTPTEMNPHARPRRSLPPALLPATALLVLLGVSLGWYWDRNPHAGFSTHRFDCWLVDRPRRADYLLFLPRAYAGDRAKRWPLLLFLHGSGQRGNDLKKLGFSGPLKVAKNSPDFPFIIVAPQCPQNEHWCADVLISLLDEVAARYRVDKSRLYVTGLSMGGFGTWDLGTKYPEHFAAIAPICGGGDTHLIYEADARKRQALQALAVWAFHGAKDNVIGLEESERMVEALKSIGCRDVKLTVYPDAKHDSWTVTYSNPDLYGWLLRHTQDQKRAANKLSRQQAARTTTRSRNPRRFALRGTGVNGPIQVPEAASALGP